MARVLIIDDDATFSDMLACTIRHMGHDVECRNCLSEGMQTITELATDIVYLDVHLPDGNGLEEIGVIRDMPSQPEVIILTGAGNPDGAELAIKSGAWNYVTKSASLQNMILPLLRAMQYRTERNVHSTPMLLERNGIIGDSHEMTLCFKQTAQAAAVDTNVLIIGETGAGKELFAEAIHRNSERSNQPFLIVDCAALPESLIESALFGHRKGAFTGADRDNDGLILQANKGTLFLDEIGELPLPLQKAFLRVLQERKFRPIGGDREIHSNFRLIAATNRDLDQMVTRGEFREDLFYRLRSIEINLPPLRSRKEDIKPLAVNHINRLCQQHNIPSKGFSPDFISTLEEWDWPGNVRELLNVLQSAFAVGKCDPTLYPFHLPIHMRAQMARKTINDRTPGSDSQFNMNGTTLTMTLNDARKMTLAHVEKQYLKDLMHMTAGDKEEACRIADLSMRRLYALLKKYGLTKMHIQAETQR